ncbi:reticulata-related protein 1, chloroplastic [Tanacetum coccineum]
MAIVAEVFDDDDGGGGGGEVPPPNGGGGGGGDGDEDDDEEKEFGQLIGFKEVMKVVEEKGVELPGEMFEAAKGQGLREVKKMAKEWRKFCLRAIWTCRTMVDNLRKKEDKRRKMDEEKEEVEKKGEENNKEKKRKKEQIMAKEDIVFVFGRKEDNPKLFFGFKENYSAPRSKLVIDSCCVTFAEVQKRGKDFWDEFELYAADLLVGIVVDVALVGMLAPYARIGKRSLGSGGLFSGLKNSVAALPSSSTVSRRNSLSCHDHHDHSFFSCFLLVFLALAARHFFSTCCLSHSCYLLIDSCLSTLACRLLLADSCFLTIVSCLLLATNTKLSTCFGFVLPVPLSASLFSFLLAQGNRKPLLHKTRFLAVSALQRRATPLS